MLDTETTGFSPDRGDRIVEIGAVELIDRIPSGRFFHEYIQTSGSLLPVKLTFKSVFFNLA